MAKYKVLRALEHGTGAADQKLYLPAGSESPGTVNSVGHGRDIPVDVSGEVDLTAAQAEPLIKIGTVAPIRVTARREGAAG